MQKTVVVSFLFLFSSLVSAKALNTIDSVVTELHYYEGSPSIYFVMESMPASAKGCDTSMLVLSDGVVMPEKKGMLLKLRESTNKKQAVTITYDDDLDCVDNYIDVMFVD